MEYKDPGRYIPKIYLLYSWGSLFGVPSRVPLGNRLHLGKLDVHSRWTVKPSVVTKKALRIIEPRGLGFRV